MQKEHRPDTVEVLFHLTLLDGYNVLQRFVFRELPFFPTAARSVIVSAFALHADTHRSLTAGFGHHVLKPVTLRAPDELLRDIMARRRA